MNDNKRYAEAFRDILKLRYEPVAVRLVREDEDFPEGYPVPDKQMSYCQSVMQARHGLKFLMPLSAHSCTVGASSLGMSPRPEKVASGEFHFTQGLHESTDAVKRMIDEGAAVSFKTKGTVVCPLKDADFEPDAVIFTDIPERIYWFGPLRTAEKGGRVHYVTAPFQAVCVDATATPVETREPNISLGCMGCRKRTDLKPDEMIIGVPGSMIPEMVGTLMRYRDGVIPKTR